MISRSRILALGALVIVLLLVGCGSRWLAGGKLHFDQERYEQALENFQKAAEEQPDNPETHMWVGSAMAKLERDEEAVAAIERAEERKTPELAERIQNVRISFWSARYNSGLAYAKDGADARAAGDEERAQEKLTQAVDRFERAVLFCPDSVKNYSNLGKVLFQLGQREQGMRNFNTAREMAGNDPGLVDFLFRVFRSLGVQEVRKQTQEGYGEAVEMFRRAAEFDRPAEDMAAVYFNLGVAYSGLADFYEGEQKTEALQNAAAAYLKVLEMDPQDTSALENAAYVYVNLEEYEKALEMGRRLVDVEPWNHRFHFVMVKLYNSAGDRESSAAHLMLQASLQSGEPASLEGVRQKATAAGPGSDILNTLRTRGEPQQIYLYSGSRGTYDIWFYWTEGRVFIFDGAGNQLFRGAFARIPEEKLPEILGP
jgi:tetratricopeptide (TPR) repeat protein